MHSVILACRRVIGKWTDVRQEAARAHNKRTAEYLRRLGEECDKPRLIPVQLIQQLPFAIVR